MGKQPTHHSTTEHVPEQFSLLAPNPSWQRQKTKGWRFGVLMCGVSALLVFTINLSSFIWSIVRHGLGRRDGMQTLFEGDCTTASKLNTGIHFLINALSTILLSSSNYCMQCLSAPTRKELDDAHSKGRWLDIGVMSTRNLRSIATKRVASLSTCCSSLPLLTLVTGLTYYSYNSAVFLSIAMTDYTPIRVTTGFLSDTSTNWTSNNSWYMPEALRLKKLNATGELDYLDNLACINAYAQEFQTRGSVLVVTEDSKVDVSSLYSQGWVCDDNELSCDISPYMAAIRTDPSNWNPDKWRQPVSYCLSESVQQLCRVQSSAHLATVVIFLNLAKAMITLSFVMNVKVSPLMTIGDVVASYLWRSDPSTENMCLASKRDIKISKAPWPKEAKAFKSKRRRLFAAASKTRWTLCILM